MIISTNQKTIEAGRQWATWSATTATLLTTGYKAQTRYFRYSWQITIYELFSGWRIKSTLHEVRLVHYIVYGQFKVTSIIEIRAFIGLLHYHKKLSIILYSPNVMVHPVVFSAWISSRRSDFDGAHFFQWSENRDDRWQNRFAAIRWLFEECNENFGRCHSLRKIYHWMGHCTPIRNQITLKHYPNKPANCGLLLTCEVAQTSHYCVFRKTWKRISRVLHFRCHDKLALRYLRLQKS